MAKPIIKTTPGFKGLNNVTDPLRLDPSFQTRADNVDIRHGAIVRCRGFAQASTNFSITGAYATQDMRRLYLVDQGELRFYALDLTYRVLATGVASDRTYFAEVNGMIFYSNGTDFGVIEPDGVRSWGIPSPSAPDVTATQGALPAGLYRACCTFVDAKGLESGSGDVASIQLEDDSAMTITGIPSRSGCATRVYVTAANGQVFLRLTDDAGASATYDMPPEQLGTEIPFWLKDPPRGSLPAYFGGRLYLAEWFPELDFTVLWPSQALGFHHFDYSGDGVIVPGHVLALAPCATSLIVPTEREIYAYDGTKLTKLASYGGVPGYPTSRLGDDLFLWTQRGLCKALPFANLTERLLSVAPGVRSGAMVLERDGERRFVVALQKGGTPYNAY